MDRSNSRDRHVVENLNALFVAQPTPIEARLSRRSELSE